MDWKYGGIDLSPEARRGAEQAVRDELSSAVLIECEVSDADESFDVGDFRHPDSDQAAYDEVFLTSDGSVLLPDSYPRPQTSHFCVAFFLHFFQPESPLLSSYGSLRLPSVTAMPERLNRLVPYEPVT